MIRTIGILDWGIGGLSVLNELQAQLPQTQFVYVSDSGFTPYGKVPASELKARVELVFDFLISQKAELLVIGCNAASTPFIGQTSYKGVPLLNVIEPICARLKDSNFISLAVFGGQRTIDSSVYPKLIGPQKSYMEIVGQPLSAAIEAGVSDEPMTSLLNELLKPMKEHSPQALILACTHYPAVSRTIAEIFPNTDLIDPAHALAERIVSDFKFQNEAAGARFFTSGDIEQTKISSQLAFNRRIQAEAIYL